MANEIQAIATNNYVLATQQAVTHDGSLSGNGTVESPLSVVPDYNKTMLWSGTAFWSANPTINLSESLSNFNEVEFYISPFWNKGKEIKKYKVTNQEMDISVLGFNGTNGLIFERVRVNGSDNYTKLLCTEGFELTTTGTSMSTGTNVNGYFTEIWGINRI